MNAVTRIHAERQADADSEVGALRDECDRLRADLADARSPRPVMTVSAALDYGQAELFLLSLDGEMRAADGPRAAYLLGLAEGHLANMIELVRGLTR
jgi:hypothetical protein